MPPNTGTLHNQRRGQDRQIPFSTGFVGGLADEGPGCLRPGPADGLCFPIEIVMTGNEPHHEVTVARSPALETPRNRIHDDRLYTRLFSYLFRRRTEPGFTHTSDPSRAHVSPLVPEGPTSLQPRGCRHSSTSVISDWACARSIRPKFRQRTSNARICLRFRDSGWTSSRNRKRSMGE